jgi:anti-anti-sigma factor
MASLTESQLDHLKVIRLSGPLTFDGVVPIARRFEALTGSGSVIVDLAGVPVITTPGLSLLLSALKRLQHHGGQLVLIGLVPNVRDLLRRCRLDRVFVAAEDEAAAERILMEGATAQPA